MALGEAGGEEHVGEIAGEAVLDAGPQDLHGHIALAMLIAHPGLVDLRDGGGGQRFGQLDEGLMQRAPESRLDGVDCNRAPEGLHPVLQHL